MSRLFKCYTQTALMLGACPCLPAGFDFATIGDVAFQETVSIFVINFAYMIVAKLTNFAARCAAVRGVGRLPVFFARIVLLNIEV